MPEAWIIDGVRSPRGRGKESGSLHDIHPQELLAQVLNALVDRVGVDRAAVEDVIIGNNSNVGDHGNVIGRMSVLAAGWPVTTPGFIVNRFCGSGQQAVNLAAMAVAAGHMDLVVGGGVESMSRRPPVSGPADLTAGNEHLRSMHPLVPQGISADLIATLEAFSREDCDAFAVESQRRTEVAQAEGRFDKSLVAIHHADGSLALDVDEHPRPGSTVERMGALEASFAKLGAVTQPGFEEPFDDMCKQVYPAVTEVRHVHHAGNSSGVVDGAAALLVASSDYARAHGLRGRARITMSGVAGAEPVIMLTAPGPAAERCLRRAGMKSGDIDIWEINEAFAAVPLKTMRDRDLDPAAVNVNGGAIALGHPIGATGAILIQTALDELERRDASTALVTMCTGGGMGTATIIERI